MTQCQWVVKVCSFDTYFVFQKAILNWCLVHPLRSKSYLFPSIHLKCPLWNAASRSSHRVWPTNKDVSTAQWPCFHPHSNIVHDCPFHFSVCFHSLYKTDINGDFRISSKIIYFKCGKKPWLITYCNLVLLIWNFDDMGSVWHIRLWTSLTSSTELLLNLLFTQYIAHTTCGSSTFPSKNGNWTVCITAIPEKQMMK